MRQSSHVQPQSSSRHIEGRASQSPVGLAGVATTCLLAIILVAGPLVLGAARLWYELPLLGVVALLLLVQGLRLTTQPFENALRRIDAIDLSVVIFVLYVIARWLTSPTEYFSRLEAMNVLAYATIFFACRYGLVRRTQGLILVGLLVVLGVGEAGFGYYLSHYSNVNDLKSVWFPFGPTERLHLYYAPRWVGTYGCPNHYASLLVMATAAALAMGSFSKLAWPLRIVLFYLGAMMMVGIFFSVSRGSWISLLAAIIALAIFGIRYGTLRWWIPVTGALILMVSFVAAYNESPFAQMRVAEIEDAIQTGTVDKYVRFQLAEDALHIAYDHPVFGTGPGTFIFIHPRYQSNTFAFKAMLTHDDYLNCLDDYGVTGFAIAIFFVMAVTLKFFRRLRADSRWQDRVLVATGFAAWSALAVHSLFDFNLHIPANALMLFALTGLGLKRTHGEEASEHWSTISLVPLGRWLGIGLIILSIAYGIQVWRTAISDIIYEKTVQVAKALNQLSGQSAQAIDQLTTQSIQGVENALSYDSGNAQALVLLGDLYRIRASRQQDMEARIGEGQKALAAYQRALKANSIDDTIQARRGMTFDLMRRYPEAYICYTLAVTAQPHDGQFWNVLGNHYWQRGMLVKAEQAYLMAMQCPYGGEKSAGSVRELRKLLNARDVPVPEPGTNPLSAPTYAHPPTTP